MDPLLLRRLQSIKDMEENPPFKYQDIELSTFKAMYPDVIIVDQSLKDGVDLFQELLLGLTLPNPSMGYRVVEERDFQVTHGEFGDSPATAKMELHTNTFTRALGLFQVMSTTKAHWTIILKEGLYINPRFNIIPDQRRKDASLEIVGMKGARILLCDDVVKWPMFYGVKVTMRNVSLHDRRDETPLSIAFFRSSTAANRLMAYGKSNISLKNCLVTGCWIAFYEGSTISAENSHFITCPCVVLAHGSRCVLYNCFLDARGTEESIGGPSLPAFSGQGEAGISCSKTEIRGYGSVADMKGSGAKAVFQDGRYFVWDSLGRFDENSSVKFLRNYVDAPNLISEKNNVSGEIVFRENRLSSTSKPVFSVDQVSFASLPDCDFIGEIHVLEYGGERGASARELAKARSKYTKEYKREKMTEQRDCQKTDIRDFNPRLYKRCQQCYKIEDDAAIKQWSEGQTVTHTTKFSHCARCRAVSYCSEECQAKHWPDHRLSCTDSKARKGSSDEKSK